MNQEILEKFKSYIDFLGCSTENMNHSTHEKLMFVFEDDSINKMWKAFLSVYSFGYKNGRIYEANHHASVIINSIKDIK